MNHSLIWRGLFCLGGVAMLVSGPMHPKGPMVEMLAHPDWVPSHAGMLVGFVAMTVGLVVLRKQVLASLQTRKWLGWAAAATALQSLEMFIHMVASVDHAHLVAGHPTPILTTHLWMSVVVYPLFAAAVIGGILAASRERILGSPWIAWMGVLGAAGHGIAAPLVVALGIEQARVLFPLITALAIWLVLAGVWRRAGTVPMASASATSRG
jgi:hypothetical protein